MKARKYKTASISLPQADRKKLDARLRRLGMTRSEYVRDLIRRDIDQSHVEVEK